MAVTDYIEAQGTLFFDMKSMAWSEKLVGISGLKMGALPELVKPTDIVGKVSASAARDMGNPGGNARRMRHERFSGPRITAPGDKARRLHLKARYCRQSECNDIRSAPLQNNAYIFACNRGNVVHGVGDQRGSLCQRWFRDAFCSEEKAVAAAEGKRAFALMDELAEKSPVGARGVMFHPYLQGERSPYWDADLRASFTGISISSTKGDFMRALLEGVAFSLKDCYGAIEEIGLDVKRIFLIGGGAKSKLWSSIIANVFDKSVAVPIPGDASYGTALIAGVGAGAFKTPAEAVEKCLKIDRFVKPDPQVVPRYAELFKKYKAAHDALAPSIK